MGKLPDNYNEQNAGRIRYLIAGYIQETLTEREQDELDEWVSANDENLLLFEDLTDENNVKENMELLDLVNSDKALARIKEKAIFPKQKRNNTRLWTYAVAASVILILGVFVVQRLIKKDTHAPNEIVTIEKPDILPGGNKAVLTLSDGSRIILNDAANGLLKNENGTDVNKTAEGELAYITSAKVDGKAGINILSTPKGGQFRVTLPDGSKVWLNAASSLKYPSAFAGTERKVELTGEAYFEVTKNASMPFRVKITGETEVEVLGTEFNVMAYSDELSQQATLLEGSLKINNINKSLVIKPGEQALISRQGYLTVEKAVDTEKVTAWKNGNFDFKDASIEAIMRQVARWYDVDVIYKANITHQFNADVSRNEPVSKLLHLLELTNRVHFKIENKTIYVLP